MLAIRLSVKQKHGNTYRETQEMTRRSSEYASSLFTTTQDALPTSLTRTRPHKKRYSQELFKAPSHHVLWNGVLQTVTALDAVACPAENRVVT